MKNPYGIKNGALVTVESVEKGLACDCTCPACGEPLEAHKGNIKDHYFKHYNGSDCGYGLETAAHVFAKNCIEKNKILLLPSLKATPNWEELKYLDDQYFDQQPFDHSVMFKDVVRPWYKLKIDSVALEKRVGRIVPDIVVVAKGRELLVEIKVTHGIDEEKSKYIMENNLSVVEYDFSSMRQKPDFNRIESALTVTYKGAKKGKGLGRWVNHLGLEKAKNEVTEAMKVRYPNLSEK
jgi:hypothetical protein